MQFFTKLFPGLIASVIALLLCFPTEIKANAPESPNDNALTIDVIALLDVSCYGLSTGAVTVLASGGVPLYTYVWSNGTIGPVNIGLSAGVYTVTCTDLVGATATLDVTIDEPDELDVVVLTHVNIDCEHDTGSATVGTEGGTGLSVYLWSNGNIGPVATDLSAGVYVVTATDENGCISIETITVTADLTLPAVNASVNAEINCLNPTVTLDGTGSAIGSNILYLWTTVDGHILSGANTLNNCVVDEPGTYVLLVTNLLNSCSASDEVTVTADIELPAVNASVNAEINCLNANVTLDGTGSALGPNILYLWTTVDGHIVSGANTLNNCVVDEPGVYTLLVTNLLNGCTASDGVTVTADLDLPLVNASVNAELNCLNATVTLDGTGSSTGPNLLYLWTTVDGHIVSGANTLNNCVVDEPGVYVLLVTDLLNGCSASDAVTVTANLDLPIIDIDAAATLGCLNSTVILDASASTPSTGLLYLWATVDGNIVSGHNTATPTVNAAGTYTLTATIALTGCSATASVEVIGTPGITVDIEDVVDVDCFGGINGSATVVVTTGTAPYTYLWSNGQTGATAINLSAGNHTVTVTDAAGCEAIVMVTIGQPNQLQATATATPPSSAGASDGSIALSVTGGTSPYTYLWSNGMTMANPTGLAAGTYSVVVTDANGCTVEIEVVVPDGGGGGGCELGVTLSAQNTACGQSTGTATATATNPNGNVTYAWSNGMTTQTITGLAAGTYSVTVEDADNCEATGSIVVEVAADVTPPTVIVQNITVELDSFGNAAITAAMINNGSFDLCGNVTVTITTTDFDCDDLGANDVTLTVTDPSGNTATATAVVTVVDNMLPSLDCPDNISVTTSGIINYDFPTLLDNCSDTSGITPVLIAGLPSGAMFPNGTTTVIYAIVTPSGIETCSFTVTIVPTVTVVVDVTPPDCPGMTNGSATVDVTGCTGPFTYMWMDENGASVGTTATVNNLGAGVYTVIVASTTTNCSAMQTFTINDPTPIDIDIVVISNDCEEGGSIEVTVSGGTPPYTYAWFDENGQLIGNTASLDSIPAGDYTVEVTDANGCVVNSGLLTVNLLNGTLELSSAEGEVAVYPNPTASGYTNLNIDLPTESEVEVRIHSIQGDLLKELLHEDLQFYSGEVDLSGLPSGSYLLRVLVDGKPITRNIVNIH